MSQKWTSTAGPRQTKAINAAINAVAWRGQTRIEITDHGRHELTAICGEIRPQAMALLVAIGDYYDWTITRDNHAAILARLTAALPLVVVPEDDKRTTAEERAERARILQENSERNAREQAELLEARGAHLAELKRRYPWAKQDGSGHARTAANLKRELTAAFPGVAFRAKSESFSMGNSVDVYWTDGPTSQQVDAIAAKYRQGSFNGMEDIYEYSRDGESEAVAAWLGQSKYVSCNRSESDGMRERIAGLIQATGYVEQDAYGHWSISDTARRLWSATAFPVGAAVVGLCDPPEGVNEHWGLLLDSPQQPAPATVTAPPSGSARAEVQKHRHTKRGTDMWLVVLSERTERDEFERIRAACKAAGGWYSRQWGATPGGFAFDSEVAAVAFAATLGGPSATVSESPTLPAVASIPVNLLRPWRDSQEVERQGDAEPAAPVAGFLELSAVAEPDHSDVDAFAWL